MSKGLGAVQREVLQFIGRAWIDDDQGRLVSAVFAELRSYHKDASISRALRNLVEKGLLTRGGDFLYLPDDIRRIDRREIIERDSGNGLPWWDRKQFQKS